MGQQGIVTAWDDDRGFGFVVPNGRVDRVFVHISAFDASARPQNGDRIEFVLGTGRDGRPAAVRARILGMMAQPAARQPTPDHFDRHSIRVWAACLLMVLVLACVILDRAPLWFAALYAVMGVLSFALYWWDKRAARSGGWRTAEARLHAIDLAFGIIGGLLAQQVLRHKTSKPNFIAVTAILAGLHALALIALVTGLLSWRALEGFWTA